MPQLTKAKPNDFSPLERDDALTCLALGSGNPKRVQEMLAEKEIQIPLATIKSWAYGSERERYQRIRQEVEHFRNTRIADQIKANALLAGEAVDKSLTQLHEKLDQGEIPAKSLSGTARDSAVVMGIHVQRGEEIEGKPNLRVSHDFSGLLAEYKELGGDPAKLADLDGDAVEEEIPELEERNDLARQDD